jgi:hypothetical protein
MYALPLINPSEASVAAFQDGVQYPNRAGAGKAYHFADTFVADDR